MRTPAGKECSYFYGDYYRGRQVEECRLLKDSNLPWRPQFCETCPVPGIQMANACKFMRLLPRLERPFPFIRQQVAVRAVCDKTNREGFDPHVGCGNCHELPPEFTETLK